MGDHTFMERIKEGMKIKILLLLSVFVICLLPLHVFAQCVEGNCTDGKGTLIFPQGAPKYVGEFRNGKRDGKGTLMYPDLEATGRQKQYEGQWKEDMPSGKGTLTFYDGRKFVGEWKFETVVSKGEYPYQGKNVPATMKNFVISGQGTMFYPDGRKEVGEFKNDKFTKK
jgi:hypothetical protein